MNGETEEIIKFKCVSDDEAIETVAELGREIWNEHYATILSKSQIDYMLDKFQSKRAVTEQIESGYRYFLAEYDGESCGYVGVKSDGERLFLSKLYLKKEFRGKGVASKALKMLERICEEEKLSAIWLTVNKYNLDSKAVYEKKGFKVIDEQVNDIGSGYVMDDYIMQKDL